MPNWTYTTIEFEGTPENVEHIFNTIKSKNSIIDFDKIIPQPECIKNTPSLVDDRLTSAVRKFYEKAVNSRKDPMVLLEKNKLSKELKEEEIKWNKEKEYYLNLKSPNGWDLLYKKTYKKDFMAVVKNYVTCLKETGHIDWYDWNIDNWGCKWNADDASRDGNSLSFCTPWGAPYPIFHALTKQFTNVPFTVYINDEFSYGTNVYEYSYDEDENDVVETYFREEEYEDYDDEEDGKDEE